MLLEKLCKITLTRNTTKIFNFFSPKVCTSVTFKRALCTNDGGTDSDDNSADYDMDLKQVVKKLQKFAPNSLAEKWDNVGLLVEPTPPHQISTMLLTNDLTESVLEEAIQKKANMIVSYHPPIFVPLKQLTQRSWKERIITKCIENRIAVYSPHTSYDAVKGGVNDWLIGAFGDLVDVKPVDNNLSLPSAFNKKVQFLVASSATQKLKSALSKVQNVVVTVSTVNEEQDFIFVSCCTGHIPAIMACTETCLDAILNTEVLELQKAPSGSQGMGRTGKLKEPISLDSAVKRIKQHLDLTHVRLASSPGLTPDTISSVAVCAGSGGSILKSLPVSLYLTGEMSHHEVLHAVQSGTNVVLCDHSNTERGYLKVLKQNFEEIFNKKMDILISDVDRDPLIIV